MDPWFFAESQIAQLRLSEIAIDFDFGKSEIVCRMEPASTIVGRLGGPEVVARITATASTAPYRWQYPRSKGGTDGLIPQKHHPALLAYAKSRRIKLRAEDFLPVKERGR